MAENLKFMFGAATWEEFLLVSVTDLAKSSGINSTLVTPRNVAKWYHLVKCIDHTKMLPSILILFLCVFGL